MGALEREDRRRILLAGGVKCHSPLVWPDEAVLHTNLAARNTIVAAYHMKAWGRRPAGIPTFHVVVLRPHLYITNLILHAGVLSSHAVSQ